MVRFKKFRSSATGMLLVALALVPATSAFAVVTSPQAPTGLSAMPTANHQGALLTWTNSDSSVVGYDVFIGSTAGGESLIAANGTAHIQATKYAFSGLTWGSRYYTTVKAYNASGLSATSSEYAFTVTASPTSVVRNVVARATNGQATITWSAPAQINGSTPLSYTVTAVDLTTPANGGQSVTTIDGLTTTATLIGLTNGDNYNFTVIATNAAGASAPVTSSSVQPTGPAGAPGDVSISQNSASSVTISWSAPVTDGGSSITGYKVFEGTQAGGKDAFAVNGQILVRSDATSYTVSRLASGVRYYFNVVAFNDSGVPSPSTEVMWQAPAAVTKAPTNLTAVPQNLAVVLNWTTPQAPIGSSIQSYLLYRGTASGFTSTLVATLPASQLSYTDSGLTNGTAYYYTVKASNAYSATGFSGSGGGMSNASSEASATPLTTITSAPTLSVTSVARTSASLSWLAPSDTGGSAILGYNVYGSASPGNEQSGVATPLNGQGLLTGRTINVPALTANQKYYFCVTAVNSVGESDCSSEIWVIPGGAVPTAPVVTVAPAALVAGSPAFTVSWTSVNAGGASLNGYAIYVVKNVAGSENIGVATPVNALTCGGSAPLLSASTTSYTVVCDAAGNTLTPGSTYYVKVIANNAIGNSAGSAEVFTLAQGAPAAVTNLVGNPQNAAVQLQWNASTVLPSATPVRYLLAIDGGDYVSITPSFRMVASKSQATFVVTGLTNGATQSFCIEAVDVAGTSTPVCRNSGAQWTPNAPTGLSVTSNNDGSLTLNWTGSTLNNGNAIDDYIINAVCTGYAPSTTPIDTQSSLTNYTIGNTVTDTWAGDICTFNVQAHNNAPASNSGLGAGSVSTSPWIAAPVSPTMTRLYLVSNDSQAGATVKLEWTLPLGASGSPITGYKILEGSSADSMMSVVATCGATSGPTLEATCTSATVSGLDNNVKQYFAVVALNASGGSAPSVALEVTPAVMAPGSPTNVHLEAGNPAGMSLSTCGTSSPCIAVSWSTPATDGGDTTGVDGFGNIGYNIYVGTRAGHESTTAVNGLAPIFGSSINLDYLIGGGAYYVRVTAVNGQGESIASTEISGIAISSISAPTVTTRGLNHAIVVSYTSGAANGDPMTSPTYAVAVNGVITTCAPQTANTCLLSGLVNGTSYQIVVTESADYSSSSSVAVTGKPGTAPGVVNPVAVINPATKLPVVVWSSPVTNGYPVSSYVINRYVNGSLSGTYSVTGSATSWIDSTPMGGQVTWYQVAALNNMGTGDFTQTQYVIPAYAAPGAVTGVTAKQVNGKAVLTWQAPTMHGAGVASYRVTYVSAGKTYTKVVTSLTVTLTGLAKGPQSFVVVVTASDSQVSASAKVSLVLK